MGTSGEWVQTLIIWINAIRMPGLAEIDFQSEKHHSDV